MHSSRLTPQRLLAVASLSLLACAPAREAAPVAAAPSPPATATAKPVAEPDRRTLCERLVAAEADHEKALRAAARERGVAAKKSDDELAPLGEKLPASIGRCFPEAHGAWLTALEKLDVTSGSGVSMRWSLVHVDEKGSRSQFIPTETGEAAKDGENNLEMDGISAGIAIDLQSFDFDGDGGLEMWVGFSGKHHEGPSIATGRIFTAKGGTVAPYAPAKPLQHVSAMRDVDGDGRPDLLIAPFTVGYAACGSGFDAIAEGPSLVAHALPDGTFSTSDAVSIAAARKACPTKPKHVVEAGHEADVDAQVEKIACALLWGESRAEVTKQIDRECKPPPKGTLCTEHTCAYASELKHAAEATPPLLLK